MICVEPRTPSAIVLMMMRHGRPGPPHQSRLSDAAPVALAAQCRAAERLIAAAAHRISVEHWLAKHAAAAAASSTASAATSAGVASSAEFHGAVGEAGERAFSSSLSPSPSPSPSPSYTKLEARVLWVPGVRLKRTETHGVTLSPATHGVPGATHGARAAGARGASAAGMAAIATS